MNTSTLFVVLMTLLQFCKPEDEPNITVFVQDTRTEMTIQEFDDSISRSRSDDYYDRLNEAEGDDDDLDFEYDDQQDLDGKPGMQKQDKQTKEQLMQEALLAAMKKPAIKEQIGQVIPILRVMTPTQRLTLAALVSSQIMSHNGLSESNLTQIASMFAGKNMENQDDRHNVTEHLLLPISMDIAKMFRGLGREVGRNLRHDFPVHSKPYVIRTKPKRLVKRPFRKPPGFNRRNDIVLPVDRNITTIPLSPPPPPSPSPSPTLTPPSPPPSPLPLPHPSPSPSLANMSTSATPTSNSSSSPAPVAEALKQPSKDDCEYFSNSLCLEVSNYPLDAILSSIKNEKNSIMETLLTDFKTPMSADDMVDGVSSQEENKYQPQHYLNARGNRRQDIQNGQNEIRDFGGEGGYMCPSSVKYARPKRARTTSGQWKYIVNAGDYTQTLRLEMCLKPLAACSYITDHFKSQCTQVFNYHRLLTWDENKGLHMDIFKVPSCCSCHIQGYASLFPPNNDFTFAEKRREPIPMKEFPPPELPQRPIFSNIGGKREVPRPIHPNFPQQAQVQAQGPSPLQNQYRPVEQTQNLVDHLVPPGPPLPLDDRHTSGTYNDLNLDVTSYNKRGPVEYNRRHPIHNEINRPANRVVDRVELGQPPEGTNYGTKLHNKNVNQPQPQPPPLPPPPSQTSTQLRPNNIPQKPRIVLPQKVPQRINPSFNNPPPPRFQNQNFQNQNPNQNFQNQNPNQNFQNQNPNQNFQNQNPHQNFQNQSPNQNFQNQNPHQNFQNQNPNQNFQNPNLIQNFQNPNLNQNFKNQNIKQNFQNQNIHKNDIKNPGPTDQSLFVTSSASNNNELVIQPGSKPYPKQPVQYFNPDTNEIPQPSKNPPYFVTPIQNTKVVFKEKEVSPYVPPPPRPTPPPTTTTTTTVKTPQKSEVISPTGQKRINYNYHPIIDFFTPESSTSKPLVSFPTPMNHEWTPVIGTSGR